MAAILDPWQLHSWQLLLWSATVILAFELILAGLLHLLPKLGAVGRAVSACTLRAPLLDIVVATMTWAPWVVMLVWLGWWSFGGALLGQVVALYVWAFLHERANIAAARGPRIVKYLNKRVGMVRNHLALWVTVIALPAFWIVRFMQIAAYPMLIVILKFPRYRHADWINVSRTKFDGLVGHDLVWCLYCDWMTGVYVLGAEMLRNVESFWCPIRFYDGKKCDNCSIDFPDINNGWVAADKDMEAVVATMHKYYDGEHRSWFGHPARLTVNGQARKDENS